MTTHSRNRARCRKCSDVIESKYRHDFVTCSCGAISVDGGRDYFRGCGDPEDFEYLPDTEPDEPADPASD